MLSGVDIDLVNYINQISTWKNVKKGPRSDTRCPRKSAGRSFKIGSELVSSIIKSEQDSSVIESEKLGVAVLGEHFAGNTTGVPVKKRRLLRQSSSPPPRTPSLNREASLSPESSTPSPNHEGSGQLVHIKSASGQRSYSNSYSKKRANKKKNGLKGTMNSKKTDLTTTREFIRSEDFSGIALLAAAACSSSIEDNVDNVESSGMEQLATPEGNDVSRAGMKETVTTSESEGSSVSENALPVVQSVHCDNENDTGVKIDVPSKDTPRFHWDLNRVMDEWEAPCFSPPPNTQGTCAEGVVDGDLQFQNLKKEGCGREFDDMGREIEIFASDADITSNKSDKVNPFAPPTSSTSSLVGYDDVLEDLRGQGVVQGSGAAVNITSDLPESADPTTLVIKGHVTVLDDVKLASENPQNDCNGAEVFQDDKKHTADGDNMMKVQEGYDSPYEDGELREPLVCTWEKEEEKWENECVDFEFDNEYEDELDTCDHAMSENFVVGHEDSQAQVKTSSLGEKNVDAVLGDDLIQCAKDVSSKPSSLLGLKTFEEYQPQEICDDVYLEGSNSSFKLRSETKSGHIEKTAFSGNMLHMEGSSPFDDLHRRGTAYMKMSRSDYGGESYSRTERVFGSEKIMERERLPFQGRVRNEADCRWVDSARGDWDVRNNYGYTRSRNVIGDSDGKPNRVNGHDHNQSRSYAPRGMPRHLNRRQSPTERNDPYPSHRRTTQQPMRGFSRERSRGRSGFIPQGFRRGPPEEYHEPGPGPYYLARKERGFSPSFNRDSHVPRTHRRSRSRSRSMSPIAWNMNNRGTKRHSPESRIEDREQVERFPFRKPSFSGDFDRGLMPPPRGRRLSPQRNSRCFDDRNGEYRERRSSPPVRMLRRNTRFDSAGYPERLKSGDYFRPMTRPGAGRGPHNFDESINDRRKPDERYEAMNRVRRYDTGAGPVKQFRYDNDECFEPRYARNEGNGFRGTVRRPAPASIREERSPPRIHLEKLVTGDAPSTGDQDFDANALTKEV